MFEGVSVALITPFSGETVDEAALRRVVRHVLDQGVQGLVATGTTGETPTLTTEERRHIWGIVREEAKGRAFVVAGTGSNSTRETIALTRAAAESGVDGCMVVTPYYNKPTQKGLEAHFCTVADSTDLPLMIYNVPGRTGVNLLPETLAALATHDRIVAVKEASGNVDQCTAILNAAPDLTVLSGEDALTLPILSAGGKGVVSVAGHVVGKDLVSLLEAAVRGDLERAAAVHRRLFPLIQALFRETNPAPIKAVLSRMGLIENTVRLPLVPVSPETVAILETEMERVGLGERTRT